MTKGTYVEARVPWRVCFDPSSVQVRKFLAGLMSQTVRYGMPGIRRLGSAQSVAGRIGFPRVLTSTAPLWRKSHRPDLDAFLEQLTAEWASVVHTLPGAPSTPPRFRCLLLERRSAGTLFVFGESSAPLLVAKFPREDADVVLKEHGVLTKIEKLEIAPRPGPKIGGAFLQEALPGAPMPLTPLRDAARFGWTLQAQAATDALVRVAESTSSAGTPDEAGDPAIERALAHPGLPQQVREEVSHSVLRWRSSERAVLKHGDLSPQNCLFIGDQLSGIIDWATATHSGAPGFDLLNLGMSIFEHRLFLRKRSQTEVAGVFDDCWRAAPFFRSLRGSVGRAVTASGSTCDVQDVQTAFFVRRLGQRLAPGAQHATGTEASLRILLSVIENQ